ncbi:helix-turn-helix domain-containing protein [Halotalea alkalilenta]|uniref:helix-turn-helix domain-containing protein n=1 Tax=Halotalea alkalilenta TaxID=376489 RepID=UPI000483B6F4|nr:XRE family transcriptional regulator [Halotalea alkalilenta]
MRATQRLPAQEKDSKGGLGMRLRLRRKVRNMSLQEVSSLAGISIGQLSQIERGLTMPSINSMTAICAALEMPVAWLFDDAGTSQDDPDDGIVVRHRRRRILDLGEKRTVKELLTPDACTGIQMCRMTLKPGGSTGDTPYNHPQGFKCGTVLSGTVMLEVDAKPYRLEAGDSFAFPATCMIRFWCVGDENAEMIWVASPASY